MSAPLPLCLGLLTLVGLLGAPAALGAEPIQSPFEASLSAITPDPNETLFQTHYVTSNERHHIASLAQVHETGGVFIGIGTDQNFILIPALRPTHIVMMDFDQWVVDMHGIYQHLFRTRPTPEAFLEFFGPERLNAKRTELREAPADPTRGKAMERVYARYRGQLHARLEAVRGRLVAQKSKGYLNDQATYDELRRFVFAGRYVALRGDLTGERTMSALAERLRALGLEVGAVALSNAEEYFDFGPSYKRNMRALPFGDNALVFRTDRVEGKRYEYFVQSASAFVEWLEAPKTKRIAQLLKERIETSHPRIFTLPGLSRCTEGLCPRVDPCGGVPEVGCCVGTTLKWCLFDTVQTIECALGTPPGCGWSEESSTYRCGETSKGPATFSTSCRLDP